MSETTQRFVEKFIIFSVIPRCLPDAGCVIIFGEFYFEFFGCAASEN